MLYIMVKWLKDTDIFNWYEHLKKEKKIPSDVYLVDPLHLGNLLNDPEGEVKTRRINDLVGKINQKKSFSKKFEFRYIF